MSMQPDPSNPIADFLDRIRSWARKLPFHELLPGDRSFLGQYLYGHPWALVDALVQTVDLAPEEFPDLVPLAQELAGRQDRAASWLEFITTMEAWLRLARDSYMKEQGEAVRSVVEEMRRIELEDQAFWRGIRDHQWNEAEWRQRELLPRVRRRQCLAAVARLLEERRALCRPRKAKEGAGEKIGGRGTPAGREMAKAMLQRLFTGMWQRGQ